VRARGRGTVGGFWLLAALLACLAVANAAAAAAPITASNGPLRTGWYPDEPGLTPQLLEGGDFKLRFDTALQGQLYGQPLVVGNTVFVATEDNWIYGIDRKTGAIQWQRNVGVPWNAADIGCGDLVPHIGVTGTPVIDPTAGVAYFTAKSYASGETGPAVWKMHAVDVTDGSEEPGFPVEISGEAENVTGVSFDPTRQLQRPALMMMNGVVYAAFGSHCDDLPYQGWIVGVATAGGTGSIKTMWAAAPESVAVWQAGGGLVSDGEGQIIFATGNSFGPTPPPTPTPPEDLGESVVRLDVESSGAAQATDFFSPFDREVLDAGDKDLGSGAPLGLPSEYFGTATIPNLLVEVGKKPMVYLLNRDDLGGFAQGPGEKDAVVQELTITHGSFGSPSVWPGDGGYVYIPSNGSLEVLKYSLDAFGQPHLALAAEAPEHMGFGSGSPTVTSDGTASGSGIVWIVNRCTSSPECSTLNAYRAVPSGITAPLLWSANIDSPTKFARPLPDDGRIYLGTQGHLLSFAAEHHTLTVAPPGASGVVSSDVPGIDCGTTCSHAFLDETAVTLSATPSAGYEFSGWSGAGCSGTGSCQVTMSQDTSVAATFTATPPPSGSGSGGGTGGGGSGGGESGSNPAPAKPSATKIAVAKISSRKHSAEFRFKATAASGFQCRLTKAKKRKPAFSRCSSPKRYKNLKPGSYVFEVRGTNAAGSDPRPAKKSFRV
jgi:outer membrane protein assembly factor BamB